jgi:tetratricopeptide (TPR) repeat protein
MARILLVLAIVVAPLAARADTPEPPWNPEAKKHYDRGTMHYNMGEYDEAITEFKEAYRAEMRPTILWAIASSQRLKGDCKSAIRTYEAFIRSKPTEEGAQKALAKIDECKVQLDAEAKKAQLDAETRQKQEPAPKVDTRVKEPVAPPSPPPVKVTRRGSWTLGHVLVWSGAAIAVGGGVALILGDHQMSTAASAPDFGTYTTRRDGARSLQYVGVGMLAGGGVLAAIGITGFLARGREHAPVVSVTPQGASIGFAGRF